MNRSEWGWFSFFVHHASEASRTEAVLVTAASAVIERYDTSTSAGIYRCRTVTYHEYELERRAQNLPRFLYGDFQARSVLWPPARAELNKS